jgi:hypothetical protein
MMKRSFAGLATLVAITLTAGCSTYGGRVGPEPEVLHPFEAATLTIYRDGSWVGLFAPIRVELDKVDFYRLKRNQSISLQLDPGNYVMNFSIGLNECSRLVDLKPRQSLRLRLSPDCMVYEE